MSSLGLRNQLSCEGRAAAMATSTRKRQAASGTVPVTHVYAADYGIRHTVRVMYAKILCYIWRKESLLCHPCLQYCSAQHGLVGWANSVKKA